MKKSSATRHPVRARRVALSGHFPDEFAVLSDPESRHRAEQWLEDIGYRLVRLSDEGAFFMAHAVVTAEMRTTHGGR